MTEALPPHRTEADDDADEALLAEAFDAMLEQILEGRTPELAAILPDRPDLAPRIQRAYTLACSVAGRREPQQPVLGGYEILRELGHGGMGTVYLARHVALDREVAIKILPHSLALSPRAKQRFLAEARALAKIRHEHVVHMHRIVDHADMLAFEMEFVDGPSLQGLLQQLRRQQEQGLATGLDDLRALLGPETDALGARSLPEYFVRIGIAIARALDAVHRRGLVHRDVKPSNVLLRRDGRPVLADFGLARPEDLAVTQTRAFAGTPLYAAPERLRHGDQGLDGRADLYSLGVTLYEAITLSPPYQGRSTDEVLRKIESGRLPPLRSRVPSVSQDLQTVLEKAMEADPAHRYATAGELADDLERLLELRPVRARPAGPLRRLAKAADRHRRLLGAAAAGAIAVALAAWPAIAYARELAEAPRLAAQHAHAARLHLLSPAGQLLDLGQDAPTISAQVAALTAAEAAYAQALAATPEDATLRTERAAVATARWLRTQSPAKKADAAAAAASASFTAAIRDLPPVCADAARRYLNGSGAPLRAADLSQAAPEDRLASGLLALLLGELADCEAAWTASAGDADHPLRDAGLGLAYAADGLPERAYPRLFHAARAFPEAFALRLELAESALAMGDAAPARAVVADADIGALPAVSFRLARLRADLLAADGRTGEATRQFEALLQQAPDDVSVLQRLSRLALERGAAAQANTLLLRALRARPDRSRLRLDLARLALRTRDLPGYLAQARRALARLGSDGVSRGARSDYEAVLRLGGFQALAAKDDEEAAAPSDWRDVELALPPLPPGQSPQQLAVALQLLACYDRGVARGQRRDPRPAAAPIHGGYALLIEHPATAAWLPSAALPLLVALAPQVLGYAPRWLERLQVPFARSLGAPLRRAAANLWEDSEPTAGARYGSSLAVSHGVVLVGAPPAAKQAAPGRVVLRTSLDGAVQGSLTAPDPQRMFGYAVAWLGDVDGDGAPDFAVGAPSQSMQEGGEVRIHSGATRALLRTVSSDAVGFGVSIDALGDLDGDGSPELVVGEAPLRLANTPLGSATILSARDGRILRRFACERAGVWFGSAVADAGDCDGDGADDVLVGGNLGHAPGLVCLYSGRTGALLRTFADDVPGAAFGMQVGAAGDLDDDGFADVRIHAPGQPDSDQPGCVRVHSGRNGALLATFTGDRGGDMFGRSAVLLPTGGPFGRAALAIGALRGGPSGAGYVRVFDLHTQRPLQSFFGPSGTRGFGWTLADLGTVGDRQRLAVAGELRNGACAVWSLVVDPEAAAAAAAVGR